MTIHQLTIFHKSGNICQSRNLPNIIFSHVFPTLGSTNLKASYINWYLRENYFLNKKMVNCPFKLSNTVWGQMSNLNFSSSWGQNSFFFIFVSCLARFLRNVFDQNGKLSAERSGKTGATVTSLSIFWLVLGSICVHGLLVQVQFYLFLSKTFLIFLSKINHSK